MIVLVAMELSAPAWLLLLLLEALAYAIYYLVGMFAALFPSAGWFRFGMGWDTEIYSMK